jgi:ribosomal protein S18 acetylase RimI-like enzyme
MPADATSLRPLLESDLPAVARIHLAAFPDSALTRLGLEAVRRYYAWQLTGPHRVVALGAISDQALVGFCVGGSFNGALSGFLAHNRRFLALRVLTHPWLVTNELVRRRLGLGLSLLKARGARPQGGSPAPARQLSFGVLSLAVDPHRHGQHVGSALMHAAEAAARDLGFTRMHLTVAPENHRAVRFYEHLRWDRVEADGQWRGAMRKVLDTAAPRALTS